MSPRVEGSQSIYRAVELLGAVAARGASGARLSEVAEETRLHIATARRILQALVLTGFLAFDAKTKLYSVGPAIFSFAVMGSPWFSRRELFMPALEEIAKKTHDTVLFSIRSGSESVCLVRREGDHPIRVMSLDAGARRPLGAGSGSLAILAFLADEERDAIIKHNASLYGRFRLSTADVERMIAETRRDGFSLNRGRIISGVHGIAIPILAGESAVASVSVVAVAERMNPERCREIVSIIRKSLSGLSGVNLPGPSGPRSLVKLSKRA